MGTQWVHGGCTVARSVRTNAHRSIVLVGPNADAPRCGDYAAAGKCGGGTVNNRNVVSVLAGKHYLLWRYLLWQSRVMQTVSVLAGTAEGRAGWLDLVWPCLVWLYLVRPY